MKGKLLIVIACLGALTSCCCRQPTESWIYTNSGPKYVYRMHCACNKCQCSDPSCGRNPCLGECQCCNVFGNIGAMLHGDPCWSRAWIE